jgi:hypothetical protein
MTRKEFKQLFDEDVPELDGPLMDLAAMLLLKDLVKCEGNIISSVEHDMIYFATDVKKLLKVITPEQVKLLASYGVVYDDDTDSLMMYV